MQKSAAPIDLRIFTKINMLFLGAEPHKRRRFLKIFLKQSPEKPYVARIFWTFYLSENCEKNARNQAKNTQIRERAKREKPRKRSVFKAFWWRRV